MVIFKRAKVPGVESPPSVAQFTEQLSFIAVCPLDYHLRIIYLIITSKRTLMSGCAKGLQDSRDLRVEFVDCTQRAGVSTSLYY